jgi:hypothetical protein
MDKNFNCEYRGDLWRDFQKPLQVVYTVKAVPIIRSAHSGTPHKKCFVRVTGRRFQRRSKKIFTPLACNPSKLHAHLERDHARRAVAAQTDAEQTCWWRRRGSKRPKPNLGAARSIGAYLSRDAGVHIARKREIRMIKYVEELSVETQLHALRNGKPLGEVEIAPEELRAAQGVAAQISKLACLWAVSSIAGSCGQDLPVGELLLARIHSRDKGIGIEPLNRARRCDSGNGMVIIERHSGNHAGELRAAAVHDAIAIR